MGRSLSSRILLGACCLLGALSVLSAGRAWLRAGDGASPVPRTQLHRRPPPHPNAKDDYASLARVSRLSSMGELAGSLAHELNQPLTAIVSNAQAARRYLEADVLDMDELREIVKDVSDEACRASATVRQIRALINGESPALAPLDIVAVIDDVLSLVRGNALGRGISLTSEVAPSLPRVNGDAVQIQQLLLNVLLNAFDAVDNGRRAQGAPREVAVRAALDDGMVRISVRDTGTGVAPDELETIFEPFVTSRPQGMGLGLSISRSIAARHGGTLRAWNNADHGMTFVFSLAPEGLPARRATPGPLERLLAQRSLHG